MTKQEIYAMVIKSHKESGQGIPWIVKLGNDPTVDQIDELVEEGFLVMYDNGGSLGHPFTNQWYMATTGYNVWIDGGDRGGQYLTFIRFYLGILGDNSTMMSPSQKKARQDPEFMVSYSQWLSRNIEELEIMDNLVDYYDEPLTEFTQSEVDYIKSRGWYKENKTFSYCLGKSNKYISTLMEQIGISKQLVDLYHRKGDDENREKMNDDIYEYENTISNRRKITKWLEMQNPGELIQNVI